MHRCDVHDPADPRIADYRSLKDARLARQRGRFIVEGRENLRVLLERSPFEPESVLLGRRAFDALGKLLLGLRELGYARLAFDPAPGAVELRRLDPARTGPAVLLFGSERPGLSAAARAAADRRVRIAMQPGVDSLNVAVAAGIALASLAPPDSPRRTEGRPA